MLIFRWFHKVSAAAVAVVVAAAYTFINSPVRLRSIQALSWAFQAAIPPAQDNLYIYIYIRLSEQA